MTTLDRTVLGAGLGVLTASLAFPATGFFGRGEGFDLIASIAIIALVLPFMAVLAGPGAILLAWIHAVQMERWARRARTIREIRTLSVLLGLPLGVANLVLVFGVYFSLQHQHLVFTSHMAPWLLPAVAGGAGLGWGVTRGLKPGVAPRMQVVRRPPPPIPRREGPPFFDNRPVRMTRRAS